MKSFIRILRYIIHYRALMVFSVLCSLGYASMNFFSAYLVGPFVKTLISGGDAAGAVQASDGKGIDAAKVWLQNLMDRLLGSGDPRETLTRLCVVIVMVILAKNLFSYFQGYFMAFVEQGVVRDLRNDVYTAYHRLSIRYFQRRKTGDLISRVINDCNTINTNLNSALINLIKDPINTVVLLAGMVIISWRLTLLMFVIAPPSLFIIDRISRRLRKRTTKNQEKMSDLTSVLEETISNIRVVKAFAMEPFELRRFGAANHAFFRSMLRFFWLRRLASPVTEFLGVTMAVVVLWFGGSLVLDQKGLTPDEFITFIVIMFVLMQSVKALSEVNVKLQVGIAATKRVFEIIDQDPEVADPPSPRTLTGLTEGIRFRDVSFSYEPGEPVLEDISLDISVGENIALVGPSGSGKSTLVDLLPRFFDPVTGTVELDGVDIRNYRIEDLRRLFGIVTQETMLFHDTIRANIAYGHPEIPMEQIQDAAETAFAHEFIMQFEDGYDTVIGERGTKLSGGQRQRIAIARAILKNPPVLIFDEATSALDSESESVVQAAIDRLLAGRTSFVIAHRLSTIKKASRILVLDAGRIVETGTHDALYEKGGLYRRLNDIQFKDTQG